MPPLRSAAATLLAVSLAGALAVPAEGQTLRGSRSAMSAQNRVARQHDFTFLDTPSDVRRFVEAGYLVPVRGGRDYALASVSYPYARPEVKLFVERLSAQYRDACGEKLVVTSLTRPRTRQPANASRRSVHPTGMALDLRRSARASCRDWLESVLLALEEKGVLEATQEHRPPHYHVAVYPRQYERYVAALEGRDAEGDAAPTRVADAAHRVERGDTLWSIAKRYGTSVGVLRSANGLRSTRIVTGQVLRLPR